MGASAGFNMENLKKRDLRCISMLSIDPDQFQIARTLADLRSQYSAARYATYSAQKFTQIHRPL